MVSQIHQAIPDKLILGTEVYQFFKGHPDQLQNFCCENPSLVPLQYEYVIGSMVWTGFDYLGESPGYPAKGWSGSCIRTNRERRISFYILQSYWKQEPMVRFAVLDYSLQVESVKEHWALPPYVSHWNFPQTGRGVIPYMIASNCEEVSLELNGKRFYLPKPAQCPNGIITGFLPYQPGTVRAAGWRNGQEVCVHELKTSGPAVRLCFEKELMHAPAEQGFQLFMKVRALDAEDNPCFREQAFVRFQAEGGARIQAVDNGNLMGSEPYGETGIHLYQGCASVLLRLDGSSGRAGIYAWADGMVGARAAVIIKNEEKGDGDDAVYRN